MALSPPRYADPALADVVPAAALSLGAGQILGAEQTARARKLILPDEARVVVVVLIDGMGALLLRERAAHTPFMRKQLPAMQRLTAGFPSTTANSLSSLGTGLFPGAHGVVGYTLLDPARDVVFNQLTWDNEVDPRAWVPAESLFVRLQAAGVDVVSLGEPKFAGRGLNNASLAGGRFRGSRTISERVDHAVAEIRRPGRRLIYFYWGGLDKTGHVAGTDSFAWTTELEEVDRAVGLLAQAAGDDVALAITADHGMVDVAHEDRVDVAVHPELRAGVAHVGGEPRAVHLYTERGAAGEVVAAYRETLGRRALVLTRDQAVAQGWFGPQVAARNLPRIGDVVVVCDEGLGIVDSAHDKPAALKLLGHHGGVSERELAIPLMVVS